jgi:hypothetical protein
MRFHLTGRGSSQQSTREREEWAKAHHAYQPRRGTVCMGVGSYEGSLFECCRSLWVIPPGLT